MKNPAGVCILCALMASGGCRMDAEQRRQVLESARQADRAIATSAPVQTLRDPSDPARLIYTPPVSLSLRSAASAGALQVWAPFGIALPDSTRSSVRRLPDY